MLALTHRLVIKLTTMATMLDIEIFITILMMVMVLVTMMMLMDML